MLNVKANALILHYNMLPLYALSYLRQRIFHDHSQTLYTHRQYISIWIFEFAQIENRRWHSYKIAIYKYFAPQSVDRKQAIANEWREDFSSGRVGHFDESISHHHQQTAYTVVSDSPDDYQHLPRTLGDDIARRTTLKGYGVVPIIIIEMRPGLETSYGWGITGDQDGWEPRYYFTYYTTLGHRSGSKLCAETVLFIVIMVLSLMANLGIIFAVLRCVLCILDRLEIVLICMLDGLIL